MTISIGEATTGYATLRATLEAGSRPVDEVVPLLAAAGRDAATAALRADAWRLLGDVAGRAFGAPWEAAERAAWALLGAARTAASTSERRSLLAAMGRAYRNVWLLPFVHGRLGDADPAIVEAALGAAGGLGFAGLEEAVARFLVVDAPPRLRRAAVRALGHLGALSAAARVAPLAGSEDPGLAAAAFTALTEMRSPLGRAEAVHALAHESERSLLIAAVRYLAELGADDVMPTLRRLARDEDAELRMAAALGARSFKAERQVDVGERVLAALSEQDRVVRGLLARRLRSFPVAAVLEQAELFLGDDAAAVVQILGELRAPEVTRFLLVLAARADLPVVVRARALAAVEADDAWERDAVAAIALGDGPEEVRVAAAQTMGAFATIEELSTRLGALASASSPALRGAWLWALQLAAEPRGMSAADRRIAEAAVGRALADGDAGVCRRAAYVAGNLRLAGLAELLVTLVRKAEDDPELRAAGLLALEELAPASMAAALASLARREESPAVLVCASRALAALPEVDVKPMAGRIANLLRADEADAREAAARLAGLARGAVAPEALVPLLGPGGAPRVRVEALHAVGRLAGAGVALPPAVSAGLVTALEDPDAGAQEAAALALAAVADRTSGEHLLQWLSGDADGSARARVAGRLRLAPTERAHFAPLVDAVIRRLPDGDPAWEPLLALRLELVPSGGAPVDVDARIIEVFPTFRAFGRLAELAQFARSLRTAEALYQGSSSGPADADLSPSIVLWMKVLEGYVHAWLSRRLAALQREASGFYPHVDALTGSIWPTYQRFLSERWPDAVDLGGMRVDTPLRSLANALRDFQDRRPKRLDSPLSITEWARLMVFFAVDHPAGVKNLLQVVSRGADPTVRLAHRLHVLAGARNIVTHRASAGPAVLEAFRRSYYATFEELAAMT